MSKAFPAVLLAALAGCVTTNAVPLGAGTTYPAVPAEQVLVFLTEADVPGEFEKIALIHAKGDASWADEDAMVRAMQKKAGKLGANAIILDDFEEPSTGARIAAAVLGTEAERRGRVLAIRILTEDPQPQPNENEQ